MNMPSVREYPNATPGGLSELVLIAAVADGGAIGRNNELLARLPEDMARFKALTMGHPVIMGRKTWESIPPRFRPLVGRRNLVLSRQPDLNLNGAEVHASLDAALAACVGTDQVFVMGGAEIYALALPRATRLELTEISAHFDGADAFFPAWDAGQFDCLARKSQRSAQGLAYDFASYRRRPSSAP
ncbi:dihydrofolate reductase [Paucibacter sp. PLA-PC-4]|uniref:dihydrofolate reductase n=1 Tax=Paucibacter sp. PLA-PC-4 TaxID=2993655 RepID=UPI002248BCCF|nr:dihydrofolate reductase [Paucibacter sp. PLA-PC-4]MCX2861731.1 dihydrofolate reductase [Paucibacter sp. PLA-PC-4]